MVTDYILLGADYFKFDGLKVLTLHEDMINLSNTTKFKEFSYSFCDRSQF